MKLKPSRRAPALAAMCRSARVPTPLPLPGLGEATRVKAQLELEFMYVAIDVELTLNILKLKRRGGGQPHVTAALIATWGHAARVAPPLWPGACIVSTTAQDFGSKLISGIMSTWIEIE